MPRLRIARLLSPVGALFAIGLSLLVVSPSVEAAGERQLPAKFRHSPYTLMSLSVGYPNAGWQLRAKRLKKKPYLAIKAGSEDLVYGHPALVLMLERSSRAVSRAARGSVMLVGDLSRRDGGALAGHRSHQSGRDADIGFYVVDAQGRPTLPSRFVSFDGRGEATDGSRLRFDDHRNWLLVEQWTLDARAGISHIFISRPLRSRLIKYGLSRPASRKFVPEVVRLLKQPEESSAHDDHFHVRIACPARHDGLCHAESR
ncbi:MAG: penicillin-insensitive murein endopeptidase [Polyangiaceae bacterium]|nr:penicillin-insensitive murein endopeptidase [Polyangiaceae bacterium]